MAKKIRMTQEEEVLRLLKKEGFREISQSELCMEPYKTLSQPPDCFLENAINRTQITSEKA